MFGARLGAGWLVRGRRVVVLLLLPTTLGLKPGTPGRRPAHRRGLDLRGRPLPAEAARKSPNDFGTFAYWDAMYKGEGALDGEKYSWFCGWGELSPFWRELVDEDRTRRVLVPGCGTQGHKRVL